MNTFPCTQGEPRALFLARVRRALDLSDTVKVASACASSDRHGSAAARLVSSDTVLHTLFIANATKGGMIVHPTDIGGVGSILTSLLHTLPLSRVGIALNDAALRRVASHAISNSGKRDAPWTAGQSSSAWFDVDIAITDVAAAIAETGSIVLACGHRLPRAAYMVPPIHIAIVRTSQLLPDLIDLFTHESSLAPSGLTVVSGPSKTADIEGILVTGVHGPGVLHVVLVDA